MATHRRSPEDSPTVRLLILMGLPFAWAVGSMLWAPTPPPLDDEPLTTLDPNQAPWWELTALPTIGPSKAHAFVAYRTQWYERNRSPAALPFMKPSDLDAIPGVGPKTVALIAPYLRFPPPETEK